jgi:hypothetical protein
MYKDFNFFLLEPENLVFYAKTQALTFSAAGIQTLPFRISDTGRIIQGISISSSVAGGVPAAGTSVTFKINNDVAIENLDASVLAPANLTNKKFFEIARRIGKGTDFQFSINAPGAVTLYVTVFYWGVLGQTY